MDPKGQPATAVIDVDVTVQSVPPGQPSAKEKEDVKRWFDRIRRARKHDEDARKQYVKDRRLARGDSAGEVTANIVGTNIDILESFLYARDPDVDVRPARSAEPPSLEAMRDAAEDYVGGMPDLDMAFQQAYDAVFAMSGGDQLAATKAGHQTADGLKNYMIERKFQELRKRYQRRQRDNKAFAETLEIIVSRFWKDARLKTRGVRWVRSALTVGLGVLKASWQERTAPSPETVQAINDLQALIQRAETTREELDEADGADEDAKRAEYQRQLAALQAQSEVVVARGFVIDVVPPEDFQVAPGYAIADHVDAPWCSHRIPMRVSDAKAQFSLTTEQLRKATRFRARTPVMGKNESPMIDDSVQASEADAFVATEDVAGETGDREAGFDEGDDGDFVMLEEIWDRDSGGVLTGIHGMEGWVKPCWYPAATTRFYPFFALCTNEVDGQRHPQSLTSRSAKLVDEYNRIGSAEAEHRRRVLPGTLVHGGQLDSHNLEKIVKSAVGEFTVIETTMPNTDLRAVFFPKQYPQIDVALYDRQRIINELERIWGIQEALSGSIATQKTATEAQIQQSGFNARTGGRRDSLETQLGELALYTAELARANVSLEDAQAIAGPDAMWPEYEGSSDLAALVVVDIRAGSTGKPDTVMERQAWANQLPLLQQGIVQIGQLRGSSPGDIADALERLLKITAERSGDRIDIDSLLPQAGDPPAMPMPGAAPGGAPGALPPGSLPAGPMPEGPATTPPGAPMPAIPTPPATA